MIKLHHKYWLLIFFCFLFFKAFSQDTVSSFSMKGTFHLGSIIPHRPIVNGIIEGHSYGYELSFYKSTTGKKDWQQLYNYPELGISALAIDLGNKDDLGIGYGVFPFIEMSLNERKINWRLKLGYGLAYIEKPFNRKNNYKNVVIGSHFNAIIHANIIGSIRLGKLINSSLGLSLIHFSNGAYARPNLGINILSLNTGITYDFGKENNIIRRKIEDRSHIWTKSMNLALGVKEIPPVDGPKYFITSYSFNMLKARSNKSSFGFGMDLFYNTSLSDLILLQKDSRESSFDNFRLGIAGIYSFDFGKISALIEMGVYVFSKYDENGLIYHRFQSRYNFTDKLFFNLGLKTHYLVADFIEFGIGFNL